MSGNQFISKVQGEVLDLLEKGKRVSLILTVRGNAQMTAVRIFDVVSEDANVGALAGYIAADLDKAEVEMLLKDFPEVTCISLNRGASY
jgi:hypothetical protein